MTEKDKGLKEAIRRQPAFRIPTNFTYRMMQQINEEVYRKEKQQEKRLFILMVILCVLMIGGLCAWLIWLFKPDFQHIRENLSLQFSELRNLTFYLPMIMALPLLAWFNHWLRKKFRFLDNSSSNL